MHVFLACSAVAVLPVPIAIWVHRQHKISGINFSKPQLYFSFYDIKGFAGFLSSSDSPTQNITPRPAFLAALIFLFTSTSLQKILPSFRMADNNVFTARIHEHQRRNLSCISALLFQNMSCAASWILRPLSPRLLRRAQ